MIDRLSAVLYGLVIAGAVVLATAQSAEAAAPAKWCTGNWVNAPCLVAAMKLAPAAPRMVSRTVMPRMVSRAVAPRREVLRHKRVARQKLVRIAARTAKSCTGNWVNAACAAP
jgi:hypothetical protein